MIYIDSTPNPSGAYPGGKNQPFPGCIPLTDEQAAIFRQYNGFVIVTPSTDNHGATSYTVEPNTEAWEAWKATLPPETDPEPTDTEVLNILLGVKEE
jgi:hypothetical protein|nr:MAG TPA: Protein of unknown function (DUF3807) [Caudoviricetes sp.]